MQFIIFVTIWWRWSPLQKWLNSGGKNDDRGDGDGDGDGDDDCDDDGDDGCTGAAPGWLNVLP